MSDPGPQRGPKSVAAINAESKAVQLRLIEPMIPKWLLDQFQRLEADIETWPDWKRREVGLPPKKGKPQ